METLTTPNQNFTIIALLMSLIALSIMLMGLGDIIGLIKKFNSQWELGLESDFFVYKNSYALIPYGCVCFTSKKHMKDLTIEGGFIIFKFSLMLKFVRRRL